MPEDKSKNDIPEKTGSDGWHAAARAALGAIPFAGAAASEIFEMILAPPIQKRRDEWLKNLSERLHELEQKIEALQIDKLAENESFISTLLTASAVAIRTHSEEKLLALQNIVLNAAVGKQIADDQEAIFLTLVDRFSPVHINLLRIFNEGFVWSNENRKKPDDYEIPGLLIANIGSYAQFSDIDRDVIGICLKDLIENRLIQHWIIDVITCDIPAGGFKCTVKQWGGRSKSELTVTHGAAIEADKRPGRYVTTTSSLGTRFVRFLSSPV